MTHRFAHEELVFDGMVAKAYRVGVRMDDGRVVQRDLIHYPGAAVVLPVLEDRRLVLIRNYRFALDEELYEAAAGVLEEAEDPAECAARELTEETGYTAGRLTKLGGFCSTPGTSDEFLHAYLATDLRAGPQNLERYERITVQVLPDQTVREMVADGTIHDAKTIAALALYWLRKGAP